MRTRELQRAIRKGMKVLDAEIPKWRRLVDLDELYLGDPCQCVIGQIFGDYEKGLGILGLDLDESQTMGFGLHDPDLVEKPNKYESEYNWLTELWWEALK